MIFFFFWVPSWLFLSVFFFAALNDQHNGYDSVAPMPLLATVTAIELNPGVGKFQIINFLVFPEMWIEINKTQVL